MIYIDFDGVILDTEKILFEEWRRNPNRGHLPEIEKIKYIQKADWRYIINNSNVINDAIYYLKQMDFSKTAILTKIHSSNNEGTEKIKWLRENGLKQDVILVPYIFKKSDVVNAEGNILIDDCLKNIKDWNDSGGTGFFFDMDNDDYDSWQQPNVERYEKVLSLSKFTKNKI